MENNYSLVWKEHESNFWQNKLDETEDFLAESTTSKFSSGNNCSILKNIKFSVQMPKLKLHANVNKLYKWSRKIVKGCLGFG